MVLQQGLAREFQTRAINVKLNGSGYLTAVFVNSPNAELPEPDRAAFARRVAEYVRDHYSNYDRLQSIQVGFATVHGGGGFTISTTSVPYRFTPGDLGLPKGEKESRTPGQHVLVIMISRSNHDSAWLVTGEARTTDSTVQVIPDSGGSPVTIPDVDARENSFAPELLPQLVATEYWTAAQHLSHEVTRCIPIFVDDMPKGATAVPGFLGGLVTAHGGRIFVMPR